MIDHNADQEIGPNPEDQEMIQILRSHFHYLDVRAPIEFATGHIPGAINSPILQDEERRIIGTEFKLNGRESAIRTGEFLVSGANKSQKIEAWRQQIQKYPELVLYCYRGGLRSKFACEWITDLGIRVHRLEGGYKRARNALLQTLSLNAEKFQMIPLTGKTGTGKTDLLTELAERHLTLDLERLANHRGSAFGKLGPQPAQAQFENLIALALLRIPQKHPGLETIRFLNGTKKQTLIVEDESRMIGGCTLPESVFANFRSQPVLLLEEPMDFRVQVILESYVVSKYKTLDNPDLVLQSLEESLKSIVKKLGFQRFTELSERMKAAHGESLKGEYNGHRNWIEVLLREYYDPLYQKSFTKRNPRVLVAGNRTELKEWIHSHAPI